MIQAVLDISHLEFQVTNVILLLKVVFQDLDVVLADLVYIAGLAFRVEREVKVLDQMSVQHYFRFILLKDRHLTQKVQ